jgi:hypothetical protein
MSDSASTQSPSPPNLVRRVLLMSTSESGKSLHSGFPSCSHHPHARQSPDVMRRTSAGVTAAAPADAACAWHCACCARRTWRRQAVFHCGAMQASTWPRCLARTRCAKPRWWPATGNQPALAATRSIACSCRLATLPGTISWRHSAALPGKCCPHALAVAAAGTYDTVAMEGGSARGEEEGDTGVVGGNRDDLLPGCYAGVYLHSCGLRPATVCPVLALPYCPRCRWPGSPGAAADVRTATRAVRRECKIAC